MISDLSIVIAQPLKLNCIDRSLPQFEWHLNEPFHCSFNTYENIDNFCSWTEAEGKDSTQSLSTHIPILSRKSFFPIWKTLILGQRGRRLRGVNEQNRLFSRCNYVPLMFTLWWLVRVRNKQKSIFHYVADIHNLKIFLFLRQYKPFYVAIS